MSKSDQKTRSYNMFEAIYLSFFSKKLYLSAMQQWRWKTLFFLLLLCAILWVPITARISMNFHRVSEAMTLNLVNQVPEITIKNGIASTKENKSYRIYYPGENKVFIFINTGAKSKKAMPGSAFVLITKHAIILKAYKKGQKDTIYPFKPSWNKKFSKTTLMNLFKAHEKRLTFAFFAFVFVIGFIPFFAASIICLGVFSVLLGLMASGLEPELKSRESYAITALAMTPILVAFAVIYTLGYLSALHVLVLLGLQLFYLALAVHFVTKKKKREVQ